MMMMARARALVEITGANILSIRCEYLSWTFAASSHGSVK